MESMDQFTGTKAVSERHAFDVARLQRHLERELPGFVGPLTVEQFKGGQSNPTYKLVTPQRTYAMRSKPGPVSKLLPSAHAIEREFRVMSALARTDVPVAQMFLLCDDESVIGAYITDRLIERFSSRFRHIETTIEARGGNLRETALDEMERLWEEAKAIERQGQRS